MELADAPHQVAINEVKVGRQRGERITERDEA
jgi:hypothetical protein